MNFPVIVTRGLHGQSVPLPAPCVLNPAVMNSIASSAGSYRILEMGQHFSDYVLKAGLFPPFPHCVGLPHAYPYQALANKLRAAGVTGNIGEGVAGVIADAVIGLPLGHYVHVNLKPGVGLRKTPDFMFRMGPL